MIIDEVKDIELELRSLPPLEIFILLPEMYPSNGAPLFLMANTRSSNTLFYEPSHSFLYERLFEKWQEDLIIIYDCAIYIQDDFMNYFVDSEYFFNSKLFEKTIDHIEVKFKSSADFQKVYEDAMHAQRRNFNNEEHFCKICLKNFLGDKFFFLSGC